MWPIGTRVARDKYKRGTIIDKDTVQWDDGEIQTTVAYALENAIDGINTLWFSAKSAAQFGYSIYRLPNGKEVQVTECMTRDLENPVTRQGWPDLVKVGENGVCIKGNSIVRAQIQGLR
jgi:hypothetical protein